MLPTYAMLEVLESQKEPSDDRYSCYNTGGIELEVGEFFYGFVRMLKPNRVLETGTHKGISASYIGAALRDNAMGRLTTIEYIDQNFTESKALFEKLGLDPQIDQMLQDAITFDPGETIYDIIFLDTEPQVRFAELEKFYDYLRPGGFLLIHDLHRHMNQIENKELGYGWPYGRIPKRMNALIAAGELRPVHFGTPRGMTMFYKPAPEDYQW